MFDVDHIYLIELEINNITARPVSYIDLHLEIDSEGRFRSKLHDKRDDFNIPFISSNISAAPAYGVFISQLVRYSRACGSCEIFLDSGLLLATKLLKLGFSKVYRSSRWFRYRIYVLQMTTDMFRLQLYPGHVFIHDISPDI